MSRLQADWEDRLSDASSKRAREAYRRLVATWEPIPVELARSPTAPSAEFWRSHRPLSTRARELAAEARRQLRAEYGIRKVWWRRLLRR
jgi:hypothetical protein